VVTPPPPLFTHVCGLVCGLCSLMCACSQWHHTRSIRGILWPSTVKFLEGVGKHKVVADVGCGDGKYFSAAWNSGCYVVGTDISMELLKLTLGGAKGPDPVQKSYDESAFGRRPEVAGGDVRARAKRAYLVDERNAGEKRACRSNRAALTYLVDERNAGEKRAYRSNRAALFTCCANGRSEPVIFRCWK